MPLKLNSTGGGSVTLDTPSTAGTYTVTVPATNQTLGLTSGTAATASGTAVDFTGIPSWVKRITVMLIGVSTSGTSPIVVQLGTGSTTFTNTGYSSYGIAFGGAGSSVVTVTAGFPFSGAQVATNTNSATNTILLYGTNSWMASAVNVGGTTNSNGAGVGSGYIALGAQLTAVRVTMANGTDTFDAGTINIMYEG